MKSATMFLAAGLLVAGAAIAADEGRLTTVNGTVVSADKQAGSLLVKVDQGSGKTEDVSIAVAPDTKIIKAGKKIQLADVAGGEKVIVNFRTIDGRKQAISIGVESTG